MRPALFVCFFLGAFALRAQSRSVDQLQQYINAATTREVKFTRATRVSDSLLDNGQFNTGYKLLQALHKQYDALVRDSFLPDLYNITGNYYTSTANYSQALDAFFRSTDLYQKQGRYKGLCSAQTNLGNCYYYLANYDKALENYKKALAINESSIHDEEISANIYNNIGILYSIRKNYVMGLSFFRKVLRVYLKAGDSLSVGQTYNNFATLLLDQGNIDSAFYFFNSARRLKEKFGGKGDRIDSYNNMASIYFKKNDPASALKYLHMNLALLDTSLYTPDLKQTYRLFYEIYDKQGNLPLAYKYYKLSRVIGDTIEEHNKTSELIRKEITLEVGKEHLADSISRAEETKIRTLELNQKKKENGFLIASLLVAALIAALLYNRFRITRKQKQIITQQKILVDQKQKEVLDSIHYAKRIQQSLLTSEKYIERILSQLNKKK